MKIFHEIAQAEVMSGTALGIDLDQRKGLTAFSQLGMPQGNTAKKMLLPHAIWNRRYHVCEQSTMEKITTNMLK